MVQQILSGKNQTTKYWYIKICTMARWKTGGNILDFINMPKFCVKTKYKPTKTIFFLEKRKFMREKRNRAQPGEDNISSKNNKSEGMPNLI